MPLLLSYTRSNRLGYALVACEDVSAGNLSRTVLNLGFFCATSSGVVMFMLAGEDVALPGWGGIEWLLCHLKGEYNSSVVVAALVCMLAKKKCCCSHIML